MLWYNGDIKNPVSQAERLSVISEGRKRDEENIFGCYWFVIIDPHKPGYSLYISVKTPDNFSPLSALWLSGHSGFSSISSLALPA